MLILGIESSCDDTGVAIVRDGNTIVSEIVAGQDAYHSRFGGVVPEIASRKHLEHVLPAVQHCLEAAGITGNDLSAIAVTNRPGLVGSLIVGLTAAKALALTYNKPVIGINHLEAHAYAATFAGLPYGQPNLTLIVSGGHTSLLEFHGNEIRQIGRTVDDAAGEAYDKIAKQMHLGYPGGPIIDKLAEKIPHPGFTFPRPMLNHDNFDFSFSGLKTAVIYYLHKHPETPPEQIAAAFQDAVVDVLITKTIRAAKKLHTDTIVVAGGVASNRELRLRFKSRCIEENIAIFIPEPKLCTDNAVMVAGLGYHKFKAGLRSSLSLGVSAHSEFSL